MYGIVALFQNAHPVQTAIEPGTNESTALHPVKLEVKDFQIAESGA
jgi:hypothetical protein